VGCLLDRLLPGSQTLAESADFSTEQEEAAAKTAGFQAADRIGTYLRSLMAEHHDTLAVAVK
jgi:hypothetical protein